MFIDYKFIVREFNFLMDFCKLYKYIQIYSSRKNEMDHYCNNCGKNGHSYNQCKLPIMSIGVVAFKRDEEKNIRFLMIRRKDTLGFMDFMRGKYSIYNKHYILNLLKEMTIAEKTKLLENDFTTLWNGLWNKNVISEQYKIEENSSSEKFKALVAGILLYNDFYTLSTLIEESNQTELWEETEWGFPKGRRNYHENDYECALREFTEETGYNKKSIKSVENILPFEEIFTGSNYKSYKHKYYLMYMSENDGELSHYDKSEVSKMEWKTFDECMKCIRSYNLEKKRMLTNINNCLTLYSTYVL